MRDLDTQNLAEDTLLCMTMWATPSGSEYERSAMEPQRHGFVLGVKPERLEEYKEYHRAVWPEILSAISEAGIRNYTIFLKDDLLFGYYEYVGPPDEYDQCMQAMAAAPRMREWWDIMEPMQEPLATRKEGEWWAEMEDVFHTTG